MTPTLEEINAIAYATAGVIELLRPKDGQFDRREAANYIRAVMHDAVKTAHAEGAREALLEAADVWESRSHSETR